MSLDVTGLVLVMNFDDNPLFGSTGDTIGDWSIYNNDGANNGATWTGNGIYNGAYAFDGSNDHISINDQNLLNTTGFTFSTRIYSNNIATEQMIYSNTDWSTIAILPLANGTNW